MQRPHRSSRSATRRRRARSAFVVLALAPLFAACASNRAGRLERVDPPGRVSLDDAADDLAGADVVFLGELHDDDVGHDWQLRLTRALHDRRPDLVVTMEQFEADVQPFLDAYLAGAIDEELFLEHSRPWPNYAEHYRPVVEWAKREGVPVVAANIPRPLARRVAYHGLGTTDYSLWSPWVIDVDEPAYLARFLVAMGGDAHGEPSAGVRRWFAAQCIKDAMMAQSIVRALDDAPGDPPLVVHWCGRFHSDYGLGTVSRVEGLRPATDARVVSMSRGEERAPVDDGLVIGEYVVRTPD